eukprot:14157231-Ditylum_brightwellii.AAC.1
MVGYTTSHSDGVYHMWNPNTNCILISRDLTWLKQMYFKHQQPEVELSVNGEEIDSEVRERDVHKTSTDNMDKHSKPGDAEDLDAGMETEADNEADEEIKPVEEAKEETVSDGEWEEFKQTKSGQVIRPVHCLGEEQYSDMAAMALTEAEFDYQVNLQDIAMLKYAKEDYVIDYEVAAVGAGLGGGFENTHQLKPM